MVYNRFIYECAVLRESVYIHSGVFTLQKASGTVSLRRCGCRLKWCSGFHCLALMCEIHQHGGTPRGDEG